MALHTLSKIVRHKKRRGRGIGSRGAKSGRGMKGQKARAGYSRKAGFEGGQTPLYMRLPKLRGSKQKFPSQAVKPAVITTKALNRFADNAVVTPDTFYQRGLLKRKNDRVKIIGNDALSKKLTVRVHAVTPGARQQIERAKGSIELINV